MTPHKATLLPTLFLFGEAEKGEFRTPYMCDSLPKLCDLFGTPPPESLGIAYAIQALLYKRPLFFFRVREEGFSTKDYLKGFHLMQHPSALPTRLTLVLPGVGSEEILTEATKICQLRNNFLIVTERDLFDYLLR